MSKSNKQRQPVIGGIVSGGLGDITKRGRARSAREAADMLRQLERDRKLASILLPTVAEVREIEQTRKN